MLYRRVLVMSFINNKYLGMPHLKGGWVNGLMDQLFKPFFKQKSKTFNSSWFPNVRINCFSIYIYITVNRIIWGSCDEHFSPFSNVL